MGTANAAWGLGIGLTVMLWPGASVCRAESYVIDSKRTEVRFAYTMGLSSQKGRFSTVEGTMEFDDAAPERARVDARIKTASLSTDEPVIDGVLMGRDFFNAEGQSEIKFKSGAVSMAGPSAGSVTGNMTVNGITKPITLQVTMKSREDPALKYSAGARRFTASARIQRGAFNMTGYGAMVAEDVDIVIDALLRKAVSKQK